MLLRRLLRFPLGVAAVALLMGVGTGTPHEAAAASRVVGTVTDASTGEALPGAAVVIDGSSVGSATDEDGRYAIAVAPSGNQTIVASYLGYRSQRREVSLPDGETVEVHFELVWEGVTGDEVVVTAQASGQMAAINQQLRSNTIANIVSADRIQEMPDVNAAESIGRLPGVSIQRSGGEANRIAIRGLSPKYNTVTVNGVRVPSTGDDRSVDLSLIASNMLGGIEVRKAITPDMDADAIGGSVDLRLREAPDELLLDVSAQTGYNQLQSYYGNYKFAGSASNRFLNSRLGVILNASLDSYDRSADKLRAGYQRGLPDNPNLPSDSTIIWLSSVNTREENVKRGRWGGSLVADYRIPLGKITANTFYNRMSNDALHRIQDYDRSSGRHAYWDLEDRSGTTSILTGVLGLEQDFGMFQYDVSIARTASRSENPEDYVWRFGREDANSIIIPSNVYREDLLPTELASLVDAADTVGLNSVFVQSQQLDENNTSFQLNLQAPFRLGNQISGYVKTGGKLRWLDRVNDREQSGRGNLQYGSGAGNLNDPLECIAAQLPDWGLEEVVGAMGILPMRIVMSDYARNDFLQGDYDLALAPDQSRMGQLTRALMNCETEYLNQSVESLGRDYDGEERYQAAYLMAELNLGRRITFLPGIRWERDYSRYHGQRFRANASAGRDAPPDELTPLDIERENSFLLPMAHLRVNVTDWLNLRLAYTETLTRPDYIHYAPITSIDVFRSSINANNSLLRPAHAQNYDAAVSIHNNFVGLFTVAAFHKSIEDLIHFTSLAMKDDSTFAAMFAEQFAGTNVPRHWYQGAAPTLYTYRNNPYEATYTGFEIDWQTNFWYLPSFLKGLVLNANYTYITSETTYEGFYARQGRVIRQRPLVREWIVDDTLAVGRMNDQPKHIGNLTIGYDLRGFSSRLSFLWQTNRSTYVDPLVPGLNAYSGDYFRVDLALRQKLGEGLELFANLNNLNGRPDRNFRQSPNATNRPDYLEYYGFTMDLGARYRF